MPEGSAGVTAALRAGVRRLSRLQHRAGGWTDFHLPPGPSDAWVTAYAGLALTAAGSAPAADAATRTLARRSAARAADRLLATVAAGGWGYNGTVQADADSTAHAVSLLARTRRRIPQESVPLLAAHGVTGEGYRTYLRGDPGDDWGRPTVDVTAAVLRALFDAGAIDCAALARAWRDMIAPHRSADGSWEGYWWTSRAYPTGLALEVRALAEGPGGAAASCDPGADTVFDVAWGLRARVAVGAPAEPLRDDLLARQDGDGSWPSGRLLRVPPSHPRAGDLRAPTIATDARRVFTTASAVAALAVAPPGVGGGGSGPASAAARRRRRRSPAGREADALVDRAARTLGFGRAGARTAATTFADLTRETFAEPSPWPSAQLSALAGGQPLELSAEAAAAAPPALRYAADIGDPYLPPHARAAGAVQALRRVAARLGYDEAWDRVALGVAAAVREDLPVPDGTRFWVWGGVDQELAGAGDPAPPVLKAYLNLLHHEVGGSRARLDAVLAGAGAPARAGVTRALDRLDRAGFAHEAGFGIGPGGRAGAKVYYELHGWRPDLVAAILEDLGLPRDPDAVRPEIPGVHRASLATRRRAGIALRIDLTTGAAVELTTAAAFPVPLIPAAETARRVGDWIAAEGWDRRDHDAVAALLLPAWAAEGRVGERLHSLFTRTIAADGARTATVYLRPLLGGAR